MMHKVLHLSRHVADDEIYVVLGIRGKNWYFHLEKIFKTFQKIN